MKTMDLTPTWNEWLNVTMAIALRTKDPGKVLEPLEPDFRKMAKAADNFNSIPKNALEILERAVHIIGNEGSPQSSELAEELFQLKEAFTKMYQR